MKHNLQEIKIKKKHKITPSSSNPSTPNTTACGVMGKKLRHTEKTTQPLRARPSSNKQTRNAHCGERKNRDGFREGNSAL